MQEATDSLSWAFLYLLFACLKVLTFPRVALSD